MALNTGRLLAKGIARGELIQVLNRCNSLVGIWQERYNLAGIALFTAAELQDLNNVIADITAKLQERIPPNEQPV